MMQTGLRLWQFSDRKRAHFSRLGQCVRLGHSIKLLTDTPKSIYCAESTYFTPNNWWTQLWYLFCLLVGWICISCLTLDIWLVLASETLADMRKTESWCVCAVEHIHEASLEILSRVFPVYSSTMYKPGSPC